MSQAQNRDTGTPALERLGHAVKRRNATAIWCAFIVTPPQASASQRCRDITTQRLFLLGRRG